MKKQSQNKPNLVRRRRIPKMNVNLYFIEDYENETAYRPKKTNPNKANLFKGQNHLSENPATPPLVQSGNCLT